MEKINKNHFNNPVVIILILILVSVGGYFLFSKNQNGSQVISKDIVSKDNNIYFFQKDSFNAYFPEEPIFRNLNGDNEYYLNDSSGTLKLLAIHTTSPYDTSVSMEKNLADKGIFSGDTNFTATSSKATIYNGLPSVEYNAYNKSTQYNII